MSHLKTICRTLFYQFFLIFIGLSIGFMSNPQWFGWKSNLIVKSFNHIFFPVKFDADICNNLKSWGRFKLYIKNGNPEDFTVIDEAILGEEIYVLKYSYKDDKGKKRINIDDIRLRWKPWEYYYEWAEVQTDEEIIEYLEKGTLNSRESQRALELIHERFNMNEEENTSGLKSTEEKESWWEKNFW